MDSTSTYPQDLLSRLPQTPTLNTSAENMNDTFQYYYYYDDSTWLPPSTEHLNEYSDIFEYCYHQLYPEITFYDPKFHVQLICDHCNLSQEGFEELFSDQTCLDADLDPMPLFIALFGAIFVFGAFGNLITFIAGIKSRKMHPSMSAMFLFISNLAAGDFLMVVLCVPSTFVSTYYLHYWPFQKFFCVAVSYAQAVSVFVSAYSLVAISVDRYMAIMFPPHDRISRRQAWAILAAVWVLALLTCVPVALYSDLVTPDVPYYKLNNLTICTEDWPDSPYGLRQGYSTALLVLHYFLPVVVMIFTYSRIACKIWSRSKYFKIVTIGKAKSGSPPSPTSSSVPIKAIRMSMTVVLVYSLCWLPYNVLLVLMDYSGYVMEMPGFQYLHATLYWLAMLHTVLNFVLIYLLNPAFSAAILRVLRPMLSPCCRGPLENRLLKLEHRNSSVRFRRNTLRSSVSMAVHQGVNNNTVVRCVKALPSAELANMNGSTRRSDSIRSTSTRSTSVQAYDDVASPTPAKVASDECNKFDFMNCSKPNNPDAKNCKEAASRRAQLLEEPRGSIVKMFACEQEDETCHKAKAKLRESAVEQEMEEFAAENGEKCRKGNAKPTASSKRTGLKSLFMKKRKREINKKDIEYKHETRDEISKKEATSFLEEIDENLTNEEREHIDVDMEDDVFA